MYRPGSLTSPAFCHVILFTGPSSSTLGLTNTLTRRRPEAVAGQATRWCDPVIPSRNRGVLGRRPCRSRLLAFGRGGGRQLQHGDALAFAELGHQHVTAISKFDGVVMPIGNIGIDLVELADARVDGPGPDPAIIVSDIIREGEFGTGQHADRDGRI